MRKFHYSILAVGCNGKRLVVEGDHDCVKSSDCYAHACNVALLDHSIFKVNAIFVEASKGELISLEDL